MKLALLYLNYDKHVPPPPSQGQLVIKYQTTDAKYLEKIHDLIENPAKFMVKPHPRIVDFKPN